MYDTSHPAYLKLREIGHQITQQVKPRAVVVFSAHWQGEEGGGGPGGETILVNTAEKRDLIYEYVVPTELRTSYYHFCSRRC